MDDVLQCRLSLSGLRCMARVGCSREERAEEREVVFDLELRLPELPGACASDNLDEAICYAGLARVIGEICKSREYKLIESLGYDAFRAVKKNLPKGTELSLKVTKEQPPLPGLSAASFLLSEFE